MFGRKPKPARVPPIIPLAANSGPVPPVIPTAAGGGAPPPLPPQSRAYRHEFTHVFMADAYKGEHRGRFIGALAAKGLEETMKAGWQALARLHGATVDPVNDFHVSSFLHESCLCGFFVFPKPVHPQEAIAGLVLAGPAEKWPPLDLAKLPVRYFVLERTGGPLTVIKEHTAGGFVEVGMGPTAGEDVRNFVETVFGIVFGRKVPSAQDAARRFLILRHLVIYALASQQGKALHAHPDINAEAKADLHSVMGGLFSETLRKEDLWDHVSNREKAFFGTPVQNLSPQDVINAFWRKEAVHTLAWALNLTPTLNPYDVEAPEKSSLGGGAGEPAPFISGSRLRDAKELEKAREVAELWHWRSRTRELQQENRPFEPGESLKKAGIHTYADVIRMTAAVAAKDGDIPPCIGDDFPACGKPYRDLNADEWSRIRSISVERHFTLNWLCGYAIGNDWDRAPTHT